MQNWSRSFRLETSVAPEFYGSVLGLRISDENAFAIVCDVGGTQLRIARVEQLEPAPFTVLGWRVDELDGSVNALRSAGVPVHRYDGLVQDENGVWTEPSGTRMRR